MTGKVVRRNVKLLALITLRWGKGVQTHFYAMLQLITPLFYISAGNVAFCTTTFTSTPTSMYQVRGWGQYTCTCDM